MRIIILAAGQAVEIHGMVKCLVRAPHDGRQLLERMVDAFKGHQITVVVGYCAVAIMEAFPNLHYVYNANWATTNNSYSLGLTLNEEPCYVLSCDLIFDRELITELDAGAPDLALTKCHENRTLSSVQCEIHDNRINEFYVGHLRNPADPEAIGLFKISDPALLRIWRQNCLRHGNLFASQNLPVSEATPIVAHDVGRHLFYEINNPSDYLRALRLHRGEGTSHG